MLPAAEATFKVKLLGYLKDRELRYAG